MTHADQLQLRHDVGAALQLRQQSIAKKAADWHEHHQAGVLLSELAQSMWYIRPYGWRDQYVTYLKQTLAYFKQAKALVPPENDLALCGIACDEARALARLAREQSHRKNMDSATTLIAATIKRLAVLHGMTPEVCPPAWHQTAIAYAIAAQLAWGQRLGYPVPTNEHAVRNFCREATRRFRAEKYISPDNAQAYRSFMLYMALGYHSDGDYPNFKCCAKIALWSALRHGDKPHALRAMLIRLLGDRGEYLGRRCRDSRAMYMAF